MLQRGIHRTFLTIAVAGFLLIGGVPSAAAGHGSAETVPSSAEQLLSSPAAAGVQHCGDGDHSPMVDPNG